MFSTVCQCDGFCTAHSRNQFFLQNADVCAVFQIVFCHDVFPPFSHSYTRGPAVPECTESAGLFPEGCPQFPPKTRGSGSIFTYHQRNICILTKTTFPDYPYDIIFMQKRQALYWPESAQFGLIPGKESARRIFRRAL